MGWQLTRTGSSRRRFSQMATGKRASMREGPLAALFRKTAEDTATSPGRDPEPGAHPEPGTQAESGQPSASAPPSVPTTASPTAPTSEATPASVPATPSTDSQPSPEPSPPAAEQPRIPTPQERLRHAFSADIPESLMQRPAEPRTPR